MTVPQPGELVRVRSRNFVVSDVAASGLDRDIVRDALSKPQHLLHLSSVDDDASGEELSVIWEIEPGATVLENTLLPAPDSFDPPKRLDAFLDAVRWGAIESADSKALQSPFRSGIKIEDYQLDPVVRAIEMPRVNLLIADESLDREFEQLNAHDMNLASERCGVRVLGPNLTCMRIIVASGLDSTSCADTRS